MKTTNQQPATVRTSPRWKQPLISTGCVFGDQYCIECDTGDYRFSDDREKVYLIYGTDDRTELFSGRSDPGNADYI